MTAKVVPFVAPKPLPNLDDLVATIRTFANDTTNIRFCPVHAITMMEQRGVFMRQVLDTVKNGDAISGPTLDGFGDWRLKLRRYSAGRKVQVVVAVKRDHLVVVTVI